ELLGWAMTNAEAVNPRINCLAHIHYEEARAQIAAGLPAGAFQGVPFIIKDLGVELAGTVTSAGSLAFKEHRAAADSELVERYKRAGLVIFAKSTSPEFGLTYTTESKAFGLTRNPWDPQRSAGGSSGGAAAAVAGGIVPMAHASDGGGSIRVPASCTALFGLKPSRGRMPMGPPVTERWLRIALMLMAPAGTAIDAQCMAAARASARLCESLGHHVEEASPVLDAHALSAGFLAVITTSVAQALRDWGAERGKPVSPEELETVTWIYAQQAHGASGLAIADANTAFQVAATAVAQFQSRYDVLLSPTLAREPAKLGTLGLSPVDVAAWGREMSAYSPFTMLANITGQP